MGVQAGSARAQAVESGDLAWIAAAPCVLLTAVLVALLGPPLGDAFLGPHGEVFWASQEVHPEPVEHARYLIALLAPALLAGFVLASARRPLRVTSDGAHGWGIAVQMLLLALVVLCFAAQNDVLLDRGQPWAEPTRYFTPATLIVALLLPVLLLASMRRERISAAATRLARETPGRRRAIVAVATLFAALWLLTAVNFDSSLGNTFDGVAGHILWSLDEPFAILNGRTPLVDFHAQYAQLLPYLAAVSMAVFGASLGVYTVTMALLSLAALLALLGLLRRVGRSSTLALGLWLPVVATGFFMKLGTLDDRYGPANLFSLWPGRYLGAYLLVWLLVRHLDGAWPRRAWALFLAAGAVAINNPEFGLPASGATALALVAVRPPRAWRSAGRLLAEAAGGLLAAAALVALATLVRSGSLPDFALATEFSDLYGIEGWSMLPLPRIGLHLAVFATFGAALALAAVRLARCEEDQLLTAALCWSGAFGLLAGAYYVGRSHPQVLVDLFSPWALAVALLTVGVLRNLARRDWRRPQPAELAVLFGFGLCACSLAQTPSPWGQTRRLADDTVEPIFKQAQASSLVAETTRPHEAVAILIPLGHRIAYDIGRRNLAPYSSIEAMPTRRQLGETLAQLRRDDVHDLFITTRFTSGEALRAIEKAGWKREETVDERGAEVIRLVDDD